jgi:radical SAM/Cys-rich protein
MRVTRARPVSVQEPDFEHALADHGVSSIVRAHTTTLQVNLGLRCNLACHHCHVESGPKRTERLDRAAIERLLFLLERSPFVDTLDLTGGAPEMHPDFRDLVVGARSLGRRVIDRCNLTILEEPDQQDTAAFLAQHQVDIVASLPCYGPENVERQRGRGVFDPSIRALQRLNALGYGRGAPPGSGRRLDLVYNPVGATLPPPQANLEADYREALARDFGVTFDALLTITNMPIKRFAHALQRDGGYDGYMELLASSFNPATVPGLMCRHQINVAHDGRLFDCDFNQALDLDLPGGHRTIFDIESLDALDGAPVATGPHCLGCTAGAGSSCGGALA